MSVVEKEYKITYDKEQFPTLFGPYGEKWNGLLAAHGMEVRGRSFRLFWERYYEIQRQGRLIWIVARDADEKNEPIGYSCHWFYKDMHFGDLIGADDLWYVTPDMRNLGIGRRLRQIGLYYLKEAGVMATYDLIRGGGPDGVLEALGYEIWGSRWKKSL